MNCTIMLTAHDRALALKHLTMLDEFTRARIDFAKNEDGLYPVAFPSESVGAFIDALLDALVETPKRDDRRRILNLFVSVSGQVNEMVAEAFEDTDEEDSEPLDPEHAHIEAAIEEFLEEHPDATLEEVNAHMQVIVSEMNHSARDEFGGLEPHQLWHLIKSDWESPNAAIRVLDTVTVEEVENTKLFHNARHLLRTLHEHGGTRATDAGNFNRKFVHEVAPGLRDISKNAIRPNTKEFDLPDLGIAHDALLFGELMDHTGSKFVVTPLGERMLDPANTGEFYARLVRTLFTEVNLANFDALAEHLEMQHTIAYSLYQLSVHANDFVSSLDLCGEVFLPSILDTMPTRPMDGASMVPYIILVRLIRPLVGLGLMETRDVESEGFPAPPVEEVRKTPLFDRVFAFNLPDPDDTSI